MRPMFKPSGGRPSATAPITRSAFWLITPISRTSVEGFAVARQVTDLSAAPRMPVRR